MSSGEDSFNSSMDHEDSSPFTTLLKTDGEVCFGCGGPIIERYLLKVSGRTWHLQCLRCSVCDVSLDRQTSCFIKEDNIYCKHDYGRQFGTKCSKCLRHIQATDWVRRAKENVYHLACFACDSCKRQLSTGEEFALQDNKVLCKTHYIEVIEGGPQSDESSGSKQKTKRVRTTFSEEQIQILQANFQLDSNPDGQDLERIAQITGLSKRVTQVWFQNSRARQKKHQQTQQNKMNNIVTSSASATSPQSLDSHSQHQQHQQQQQGHHISPMTSSGMIGSHSNAAYNNNHLNNVLSDGLHVSLAEAMNLSACSSMTATSPDSTGEYCDEDDYIIDTKPRLVY